MKLVRVISIVLIFSSYLGQSQTSSCSNSDFELGNFTGWTGQLGSCCPIVTTPSAIVSGRHTIMTGTATDPNTCNNVPVVAPGGTYSARLGNSNNGRQAEKLTYTIPVVDASNALFIYKYAVVLQDPSHTAVDQPRFELKILNASGQVIDPVCGYYLVVADDNIPGFQTCGGVVYKNWTTVGIDLTPYIGQQISLVFATGDCDLGGHYGYAYLDAYCTALRINTNFCAGSTNITLTAPLGFSYLWSTGATSQSINIINPIIGQTISCQLTSVTGCVVSLTTVLQPAPPIPDFNLTQQNNCASGANFTNLSTTSPGTELTATSFLWNFGDGQTSTAVSPTHVYSNPGTYNVTLTVRNSIGCLGSISKPVTVVSPPIATINYPISSFCNSNNSVQIVQLNGSGNYLGGTFSSSPSGILINATNGQFSPNQVAAGNYNINYLIPAYQGCPARNVSFPIVIARQPLAGTDNSITICDSNTSQIQLSSILTNVEPGGSWSQLTGTGGVFNTVGTYTTANAATTSTFLYTVTAVSPCLNVTNVATVVVNPRANAGLDGSLVRCDSNSIPINLADIITSQQTSGIWTRVSGIGGTFNPINAIYSPALGATSSVFKYTVTGLEGCSNDESLATVNINRQPQLGLNGTLAICEDFGSVINLNSVISNQESGGIWTQSSGTGGVFNAGSGLYTPAFGANTSIFNYSISAVSPCLGITNTATINITPLPATPTGNSTQEFCYTAFISDLYVNNNGNTIQWFSQASGGMPLPLTTVIQNQTTYYAEEIINGCPSLIRFPVLVKINECDVTVYNFVSVDNDSLNEIFMIDGITFYPENNVQIFNRWGVLVYEINGYNNSDKSFGGKSEGRVTVEANSNLPEGTYYYVIKYTKPRSGIRVEKTGYLYLTY
jgi:gliding motility-associated-like protein